jgi:3-oxoacyl-[acyl-carrier-protein] synthase II
MRRVVITGMGAVSPFGRGVARLVDSLVAGQSGIALLPELKQIGGLRSLVAGLVRGVDPNEIPRKHRRSMSNMSIYALLAAKEALTQAGLDQAYCTGGRMGISIGSTVGSSQASEDFFTSYLGSRSIDGIRSTGFFKIMSHSCASNLAQVLGITGRVLAPSAACSTGCQAVGVGFEAVAAAKQDFMLCGGADEYHPLTSATFDILGAASVGFNARPQETPRPFDRDRDGIACAEGAGCLLLESLDSARMRGVRPLAEVVGFATTADPHNIANPDVGSIANCMRLALDDAGLAPADVDYVNAHATATVQGDVAECEAIADVFGDRVPVSSFKGHLGHTMGASGALELIAALEMAARGCLIPTLHLENIDTACGRIRHVCQVETGRVDAIVKNNFALGGINSSIVVRRWEDD